MRATMLRRLLLAAVVIAVSTAVAVGVTTSAGSGVEVAAGAVATAAPLADLSPTPTTSAPRRPALTCGDSALVFGSVVRCEVADAAGLTASWSDGSTHRITRDGLLHRRVLAVGDVEVTVRDGEAVVASARVRIDPDLDVECVDGPVTPIYELVDDDRAEGWNYAYLHPETGERVLPGADDYPRDPGLTDYELIVLDEQPWTSQCIVTSEAVDVLGGTVVWYLSSAYQDEPLRVPIRNLRPFGKNYWNGVQPGDAEVVVAVEGVEASERIGVYFAGCA